MKGTGSLYAAPFLRKALWVLRWQKNKTKEKHSTSSSVSPGNVFCPPEKKSLPRPMPSPVANSSALTLTPDVKLLGISKIGIHGELSKKNKKKKSSLAQRPSVTGACWWLTRGRGNWPSRLCWKARKRWGKRLGSRNPTPECWRGPDLSSSRPPCTPRSSRRSSCSPSRPGTRTDSCPRSRSRTGSCPRASWVAGCAPCWKWSRPAVERGGG